MANFRVPDTFPQVNQGCPTCDHVRNLQFQGATIMVSNEHLIPNLHPEIGRNRRRTLRQDKARQFIKYVNALKNDGRGILCIHVENPHLLGTFDQSVDAMLAALITDDGCFADHYERHLKDKKHVIYDVKSNRKYPSTMSFNTKISLDKGLEDPTFRQMLCLLAPNENEEDDAECPYFQNRKEEHQFYSGQEVKSRGETREEIVFQESVRIQAKKIEKVNERQKPSVSIPDLVKYYFDERHMATYLPKYITGFTKLKKGGSIYLGVDEHKTHQEEKKLERSEYNKVLILNNSTFHVWKDNENKYTVAKNNRKELDTGEFKTQGIILSEAEQKELQIHVTKLTKSKTLWVPVPKQGQNNAFENQRNTIERHVKVLFQPVQDGPRDMVVIEVQVDHYDGVVFMNSHGPEAYEVSRKNEDGTCDIAEMDFNDWLQLMTSEATLA